MELQPRWSQKILREVIRREKSARVKERFQALLLVAGGMSCREASLSLGHGEGFAIRWVRRINEEGLDGVRDRPIPGQPKKLPTEQEAAFLARVDGGPQPKDKVKAFRGLDIQKILKKEFRAVYSLDGVYALLRRLGRWPLVPKSAKPAAAKKSPVKAKPVAAKATAKKAGKPAKAAKAKAGKTTVSGAKGKPAKKAAAAPAKAGKSAKSAKTAKPTKAAAPAKKTAKAPARKSSPASKATKKTGRR